MGPDSPSVYTLLPHLNAESMAHTSPPASPEDPEYRRGADEPSGPARNPIRPTSGANHNSGGLRQRRPWWRPPTGPQAAASRVFELRIYESHNEAAGSKKIEMFEKAGEIAIFRRVGLQPVFFGRNVIGANLPSLTYMLVFADMAAREKNWAAFREDPEWVKLRLPPATRTPRSSRHHDPVLRPPTTRRSRIHELPTLGPRSRAPQSRPAKGPARAGEATIVTRTDAATPLIRTALSYALLFWPRLAWRSSGRPFRPSAADQKPNIVYIVADDLGWKDVGFHGSDIKTPNIDSLAADGARLEQFYAQPMCTPTRAALMTGRYPFRYGLQTAVIPSGHTYGLPTDEWLLPQALKEAGYKTAIIGKWHLGHADQKYWPRQRGFDYQYGPLIGEIDYFTHEQHGVLDWYRNNKSVNEEGLFHDAARQRRREAHRRARPGHAALSLPGLQRAAHAVSGAAGISRPVQEHRRPEPPRLRGEDHRDGRPDRPRPRGARQEEDARQHARSSSRATTAARATPMFAGEGDMSKIKIPCDNGPYRDGKGSLYEGGTRVVALANWPGHIKAGSTVDEMIHVVDMYPTLAGLAGAPTAKCKPLDGMNVWPTISEGKPSPRTEIVYNVEPFRAGIRQGDWKLIWRTPLPAAVELYNIAQDPSEKNNVAAQNPDKVAALQKRANELAATMAKPLLLQTEIKAMMERHQDAAFASGGAGKPRRRALRSAG